MQYDELWQAVGRLDAFGSRVTAAWTAEYLATTHAAADDIVVVDPRNGFSYLFDLAGSLSGAMYPQAPRVVGVWGLSQSGQPRDRSRMRGFPRPARSGDDRGHLISCAAGGGHDINLVPMDAALNQGWSVEGARFRAMERRAAASPGSLFFIRPLYDDNTDRAARFEVGVQSGDALLTETFSNARVSVRPMGLAAMRRATAFPDRPRPHRKLPRPREARGRTVRTRLAVRDVGAHRDRTQRDRRRDRTRR